MKRLSLRSIVFVVALCALTVSAASASVISLQRPTNYAPVPAGGTGLATVGFPTAGDTFCAATSGCGTIPAGGQTDFQWTAGDYVVSSIFVLPTASVTDLHANWSFQDFLGGGNSETWYIYVNGTLVAQTVLPDDGYNGDIGTVTGAVIFAPIAPVAGGYQISLVLQNTVPFGGGSVAWLDGGTTGLSYVPEPGSLVLLGSGVLGLAGLMRRKLGV